MPGPQRLFVALYPPIEHANAMCAPLAQLDLPAHRLAPVEQIHLTLQFIGDVEACALGATIESFDRSAAGISAFALTPLRLRTLPKRGRARLIAMELDRPAQLLEIQRRLAQRLAHAPRRKQGNRFLPHITLLRFRSPVKLALPEIAIDPAPFEVQRISLVSSVLTSSGAVHREMRSVQLASS